MIIGGSASQNLTAKIGAELGEEICPIETKRFPDGERYLRIKGKVEKEMILVQSTGYPQDENLVELLFLISNLKSLGAEEIKVVVPYLGYGRQEKRFKDGEAITSQIVANLIENAGATEFISLNLHEDCIKNFFSIPAHNISAMPAIADYIKETTENPIIIGPDKGALGFAEEIATILKCESTYLSKVRLGPDKVETKVVDMRY
ncbi:MAG: ribose-phosphate diphosphokinase, partial [Methanobrevibacter sp.]|nr:ribose-phosphate diphosphokinase [Methanobrevibacter sp.]